MKPHARPGRRAGRRVAEHVTSMGRHLRGILRLRHNETTRQFLHGAAHGLGSGTAGLLLVWITSRH